MRLSKDFFLPPSLPDTPFLPRHTGLLHHSEPEQEETEIRVRGSGDPTDTADHPSPHATHPSTENLSNPSITRFPCLHFYIPSWGRIKTSGQRDQKVRHTFHLSTIDPNTSQGKKKGIYLPFLQSRGKKRDSSVKEINRKTGPPEVVKPWGTPQGQTIQTGDVSTRHV